MNEENKDLSPDLLKKIGAGEIKMHPKSYFVLRGVLLAAAFLILFLVVLFLGSFFFFYLQFHGLIAVSAFGSAGMAAFWAFFPWWVLITALILIVILEALTRKYFITYRKPAFYTLLTFFILAVLCSWLIELTPLHYELENCAERSGCLPVGARLYQEQAEDTIFIGRINALNQNGLSLLLRNGQETAVIISSKTNLPGVNLKIGDRVIILGNLQDSQIFAEGIRPYQGRMIMGEGMLFNGLGD